MQLRDSHLFVSPSDLTVYLACTHAARLSLDVAYGRLARPDVDKPDAEMLARKGDAHEAAYLARLRAEGRTVVEITLDKETWFDGAARATVEAMRAGADVIYQGAFVRDGWRGLSDFLLRVERPSALGAWSYEVLDTKLARTAKPSHILQLCFYADEIARLQGMPGGASGADGAPAAAAAPTQIHVLLGSGEQASFRADDFAAYYRRIRGRFGDFLAAPPATEPYPCDHCALCDFSPLCEAWWEQTDHLSRVAGAQRRHVAALQAAGISTLAGLAATPPSTAVPGIPRATFDKLRAQAALQQRRAAEGPLVELLPLRTDAGFALLPEPSPGDLFFDIEGHPFWEVDGSLEYLWGVTDADDAFAPLTARDRAEERAAFEGFVDRVTAARAADPGLHVYHYAAYEVTALRRLMGRYGTREQEVDDLLRGGVLVDLYSVVRNAIRVSEPSYGLKALEAFLPAFERLADVKDGGTSIVEYERYHETGDETVLDGIKAYNREDCISTRLLRDWLLARKAEALATLPLALPPPPPRERPEISLEKQLAAEARAAAREALRAGLLAAAAAVPATEGAAYELAAHLLDYHRREAKPIWWAIFDRLDMTPEELVEDADAIGLLAPTGDARAEKRSLVHDFTYPAQEHKLRLGDTPRDRATGLPAGEIVAHDRDERTLSLKRGPSLAGVELPDALIPGDAYSTKTQEAALERLATSILAGDGRYPALESVLRRTPFAAPVQTTDLAAQQALVRSLDGQHLVIQGPPGTGKTWLSGRLIADLLAAGRTVGVASTSHKAIHNLLDAVEEAAAATAPALAFAGRKKASTGNPESEYASANVSSVWAAGDALGADLAAGTAWLFTHPDHDGTLDYLFIDEAGQVSLADALAMGAAARNLVLVGDPLQLAQVSQGSHPDGADASVLAHLLGPHATVPPDRGLFLERTFRLHPDVCGFVSDAFYDGRLRADESTSGRTTPLGTGLRYLPVPHEGNRQESKEEVAAVAAEVVRLVAAGVGVGEIMVVAPFNAHVDLLRAGLAAAGHAAVRVGTVDKFQGQEAPVTFYSMASSSGEDVPRGLDFLLSRNRLNVAVSRAQRLSYLVCSPRLLEVDCNTIEHMRLANALCRFVEVAAGQASG